MLTNTGFKVNAQGFEKIGPLKATKTSPYHSTG